MIKKGDFVELDFTGKVLDTGKVFDTTLSDVAKENNIFQNRATYKPIKIVVGEGHIIPGLDAALEGKETGKFKVEIKHEDAFGKKTSDLLKIVPAKEFKKQNIKPFVGLEVNVDGMPGIIRTVSGGRVIVDFNHPLAGKDMEYEIDVARIITGDKERAEAVLELMGLPYNEMTVEGKKATISVSQKIPTQFKEQAETEIERMIGLKVGFEEATSSESSEQTEE